MELNKKESDIFMELIKNLKDFSAEVDKTTQALDEYNRAVRRLEEIEEKIGV